MKRPLVDIRSCSDCKEISEVEFEMCSKHWGELEYWWRHVDCEHENNYCENPKDVGYKDGEWNAG